MFQDETGRKPWWKKIVFFLLWMGVIAVGMEIGLRALYFQLKSDHPLAILYGEGKAKSWLLGNLQRIGIWEFDATLGYDHIPNAVGVHELVGDKVVYTIDDRRGRFVPRPDHPVGRILFLGDSFTFGHGVEDRACYPALLAREYWKEWEIRNRAVMGWGTVQAYEVTAKAFQQEDPPDVVIYGMIPDQIERNYVRSSWVRAVTQVPEGKRGHPHFELEDGNLVFHGVVGPEGGQEDSPKVRELELRLTRAFLSSMHRQCVEHGAVFIVVLLPRGPIPVCWPPSVLLGLGEERIPVLDLSRLPVNGIPYDGHPDAESHRAIAEAMARSFISGELERRAAAPPP